MTLCRRIFWEGGTFDNFLVFAQSGTGGFSRNLVDCNVPLAMHTMVFFRRDSANLDTLWNTYIINGCEPFQTENPVFDTLTLGSNPAITIALVIVVAPLFIGSPLMAWSNVIGIGKS